MKESSWVLAWELPSVCATVSYKEIWASPKIKVLPSGTLAQMLELENFLTPS